MNLFHINSNVYGLHRYINNFTPSLWNLMIDSLCLGSTVRISLWNGSGSGIIRGGAGPCGEGLPLCSSGLVLG